MPSGAKGKSEGGPRRKMSSSAKAGLEFPVGRVHKYVKKGCYTERIGKTTSVYLAGVLKYLVVDLFELAGDEAKLKKGKHITARHIQLTVRNDDELDRLFKHLDHAPGGILPHIHPMLFPTAIKKKKKAAEDRLAPSGADFDDITHSLDTSRLAEVADKIGLGVLFMIGGGTSGVTDGMCVQALQVLFGTVRLEKGDYALWRVLRSLHVIRHAG
ncbi:hypothetical protein JCM1840_007372 [Sporobolomyces johnsonii]